MKSLIGGASAIVLALSVCSHIVRAQSAENTSEIAPISTGRPSFSGGTGTTSVGRVVVENGFSSTRANDGERINDFPESLIRIGTGKNTELRLGVPNYLSANRSDSGFGDGSLAFRYRFYQNKATKTTASITPSITLAAGNRRFGSPNLDPVVTFAVARQFSQRVNASANLIFRAPSKFGGRSNDGGSSDGSGGSGSGSGSSGISNDSINTKRNFTVTPSAVVSYSLTPKVGVFLDSYTVLPSRGSSSSVVDFGTTYLLTNDIQLDASAGFGVGGAAPDNFVGAGVSFRF